MVLTARIYHDVRSTKHYQYTTHSRADVFVQIRKDSPWRRCIETCERDVIKYFDVLLTVHLSIFISVINQLDAQNFCFTISLFHSSTCFEHMCPSSGGQNCRGCVMQFWPPDDGHMCSKDVEEWNKLIVEQKFCASSWLITEEKKCKICI